MAPVPIVEAEPVPEIQNETPPESAPSKPTIGIIYPPPELRNIVDKTASFVARNGPEFEARIRQNEINNKKFNFLNPGDPYNAYYQHKVKEFKEGKGTPDPSAPPAPPKPAPVAKNEILKLVEPQIIPKEPPPEFEFIVDPPSISAFDLDIVKLTAQFVARNGRQFLTNLMNREQRNYQFDFLRPQHSLFNYFTKLLEQYTKILIPPKDLMNKLKKESENPKAVLDQVRYRVEWTRQQEAIKRREEEEAERERVQYAQIDWHDFVVVETVDYQPNETGMFPPPTNPDEVGSRVLHQQRIEEQGGVEDVEMEVESDEEGSDREVSKNDKEKNMEESSSSSDEEGEDKRGASPPPLPPKEAPPLPPPLPPQPDQVVIRKDYNPKVVKPAPPVTEQFLISPITGERIPADKMQEHMRIGLLDPRWVEQRDRAVQEKMTQEEVYAHGTSIESSLKQFAERRTDIFGSGVEETAIGKKIGEEEKKRPEKVTWDGHTASMEAATRAARANITIEEQIQQIHKIKGLLPDEEKERIGPSKPQESAPVSTAASSSAPPLKLITLPATTTTAATSSAPPPPPSATTTAAVSKPPPPPVTTAPPVIQQPRPPLPPIPPIPMPPTILPPSAMPMPAQGLIITPIPPPGPPPPHLMAMPRPPIPPVMAPPGTPFGPPLMPPATQPIAPASEDEPPLKKQKTEDSLIPEDEFLKKNKDPVTFRVQVPSIPEKQEWKLNGQVLAFTLPLTDMVSIIKAKIHESTGMPPGKQKLQLEGMFIKDSNSLAFYNISPNSIVSLQVKERGGRKK
ncbi:splicing factor 3A subunit 1-like [Argiope bruennichi]|nr:splicing factor 3A subunit 1-like [Argiope bruennichi]